MPEPSDSPAGRETFARQQFMETIGAKLIHVAPGEVWIEMSVKPAITQQSGVVHAGAIAAIADSACGGAALTMMPPGSDVVSIEFKLNLLAPGQGESLIAKARVVRAGKTITVCTADVVAMPGEKLVATMLGTMMRIAI